MTFTTIKKKGFNPQILTSHSSKVIFKIYPVLLNTEQIKTECCLHFFFFFLNSSLCHNWWRLESYSSGQGFTPKFTSMMPCGGKGFKMMMDFQPYSKGKNLWSFFFSLNNLSYSSAKKTGHNPLFVCFLLPSKINSTVPQVYLTNWKSFYWFYAQILLFLSQRQA